MRNEVNVSAKPILIPGINMATLRMLSDQYNIPYSRLSSHVNYHKNDFDNDTLLVKSFKDFEDDLGVFGVKFMSEDAKQTKKYLFENSAYASIRPGKTKLLSEKAVNHLLELFNKDGRTRNKPPIRTKSDKIKSDIVNTEQKTEVSFNNSEEEKLCLNLANAYKSGEIMNVIVAALALDGYRRKVIDNLTSKLDSIQTSNLLCWTSRASADRLVGRLSGIIYERKTTVWNMIFYRIIHKYGIPLESRGKGFLMNNLKDEEWYLFYQAYYDICKERFINFQQILESEEIDATGLSIMIKY